MIWIILAAAGLFIYKKSKATSPGATAGTIILPKSTSQVNEQLMGVTRTSPPWSINVPRAPLVPGTGPIVINPPVAVSAGGGIVATGSTGGGTGGSGGGTGGTGGPTGGGGRSFL